jgi:hypothetical protein
LNETNNSTTEQQVQDYINTFTKNTDKVEEENTEESNDDSIK